MLLEDITYNSGREEMRGRSIARAVLPYALSAFLAFAPVVSLPGCSRKEEPINTAVTTEQVEPLDSSDGIQRYQRKYDTIAHKFLDLESEFGVSDSDYKFLDDLLDKAKKRIPVKPNYTKEEAVAILKTIDGIIKEGGVTFTDERVYFLNTGIKKRQFNCDVGSIIYLAIAEVRNLPLAGVNAPGHTFVRWNLNDTVYFNWETTDPTEVDDEFYKKRFNIAEESIRNGVFLESLGEQEVLEIHYLNSSTIWTKKGEFDRAIEDLNEAIRLNPNSCEAYYNRGIAWTHKYRFDNAIEDFNKAIELNPNNSKAYGNRGIVWWMKDELNKAMNDLNEAIRLNPDYAKAYYARGLVWNDKGDHERAVQDINKARELNPDLKPRF